MCGIIGIIGPNEVRDELYIGLLALQHRGQDACGILTNKADKFFLTKEKLDLQRNMEIYQFNNKNKEFLN